MATALSFLLVNIQGLFSSGGADKITFLSDQASLKNSPLIAITESWLSPDILDAEVERQIPGFRIIRADRIDRICGGVAAYLRNDIPGDTVDSFDNGICEVLLLKLHIQNHYVAIFYRPPGTTKFNQFKEALDWLDSKLTSLANPTPTISVCGDFNFNKSIVTWSFDEDGDLYPSVANHRQGMGDDGIMNAKQAQYLFDFANKHYLVQYIDKETRSVNNETIDLFFTNNHNLVTNVDSENHACYSDHNLLSIGVNCVLEKVSVPNTNQLDPQSMTQSQRYYRLNFFKAPWPAIICH